MDSFEVSGVLGGSGSGSLLAGFVVPLGRGSRGRRGGGALGVLRLLQVTAEQKQRKRNSRPTNKIIRKTRY